MNLIELLKSPQDLMALRDHLGKVLKESLDMPLKSRKLNELTARLVGADDFNTAQAMAGKIKATDKVDDIPFVVVDISDGVPHIFSTTPIQGVVINDNADEVINARDNHVPNLLEDFNGKTLACWHIKCEVTNLDVRVVEHFHAGRDRLFQAYSEPKSWADESPDSFVIPAFIRSDDGKAITAFDAAQYFEQLDAQAINTTLEALEACDFNGDYPADQIAEFLSAEPGYEKIAGVFDYLDTFNQGVHERGDMPTMGYYVEIDKTSVYAWNQQRIAKKCK
ncbi:hypothetical protein YA0089_27215 [Pseudomonas viridiflava]|uniref:hypothetical protein n=1 Tax=Pseudomonas viridiflava TaxID=33069 RepID=UPI0018E63F0A|nr:hypothetical protein [Pseudomonas viridiflava]MBI6727309.1 hypothetical protein [Pseudomonas viridiflava]